MFIRMFSPGVELSVKKLAFFASLFLFASLLNGCASDGRPKYAAPTAPPAELAVLKGGWGTYIHEIDGAPVKSADAALANWGSNEVKVAPGTHELFVIVHTYSGAGPNNSSSPQPGWSFQMSYKQRPDFRFSFICEKGHTYEFTPRNLFNRKLKVTDKNTGQS